MRLISLEQTNNRIRVGYRWLDEPLTPPRLLMDTKESLSVIQRKLGSEVFGDLFTPAEFQIVAGEDAPTGIEEVFAGFTVIRLTNVGFDDLLYAAAPLAFPEIVALFRERLTDYTDDPELARTALDETEDIHPALFGYSQTATTFVRGLPDLPFELEIVPPRITLESQRPLLVAITNLPALSREEAEALQQHPDSALLIVDSDIEKFKTTLAYVTKWRDQSSPDTAIINEDYQQQLEDWAMVHRQKGLLRWLQRFIIKPQFDSILRNSEKLVKNIVFNSEI